MIADDGDARYPAAAVLWVPPVDPALGFTLSAMAGHLFGYEAALAIDASARPLRQAREVIERAVAAEPLGRRRARSCPTTSSAVTPSGTSTACAATATTATWRPAPPCGWPGCSAT